MEPILDDNGRVIFRSTITILSPYNPTNLVRENPEWLIRDAINGESIMIMFDIDLATPDEVSMSGEFFGDWNNELSVFGPGEEDNGS